MQIQLFSQAQIDLQTHSSIFVFTNKLLSPPLIHSRSMKTPRSPEIFQCSNIVIIIVSLKLLPLIMTHCKSRGGYHWAHIGDLKKLLKGRSPRVIFIDYGAKNLSRLGMKREWLDGKMKRHVDIKRHRKGGDTLKHD